jgi:Zn-dependent protease
MLGCPGCGRLVHADRLDALAQAARSATEQGNISSALAHWRDALALLPADSKQHRIISAKITDLDSRLSTTTAPVPAADQGQKTLGVRVATGLGAIGLAAWKLKAILFGLTKGTTLFSMLLSLGVYWTVWGWKFALGLVLSIYVHEMGHVFALQRYGFKATAPMFIPGLGALIRLQQKVVNPQEDAAIGLAGPIYGLGAAVFTLAIWLATKEPIFAAIAGVGAWINLFNLLPIASLDGGRGFHNMSRTQKLLAAATAGAAAYLAHDGLLIIVALVCLARALGDKPNHEGSWKTAITYVLLIVFLTAVSTVRLQAGIEG